MDVKPLWYGVLVTVGLLASSMLSGCGEVDFCQACRAFSDRALEVGCMTPAEASDICRMIPVNLPDQPCQQRMAEAYLCAVDILACPFDRSDPPRKRIDWGLLYHCFEASIGCDVGSSSDQCYR